jgi:hypothetical protein
MLQHVQIMRAGGGWGEWVGYLSWPGTFGILPSLAEWILSCQNMPELTICITL